MFSWDFLRKKKTISHLRTDEIKCAWKSGLTVAATDTLRLWQHPCSSQAHSTAEMTEPLTLTHSLSCQSSPCFCCSTVQADQTGKHGVTSLQNKSLPFSLPRWKPSRIRGVFAWKRLETIYLGLCSQQSEASILHLSFFTRQTNKVPVWMRGGQKKEKKNSSEIIVRHSGVSRWSGQIRQADVQSHVRSHIRDSMDSFRKLWSHHPTILPSTPCDGKSCFIPHGIPKGHLQQTYTHHVYTQTQNITDIVTFAQGSIHKQESNMSASSESLHSWMLKKIYNVHNLRMQMRTKYDIYGNTMQDARDHVKVSAWSLQALVLKCVTWTEVLTSMAINSHTWKWFQKARKLKRTKTVYASKKENMSLSLNHKSPVHTILWPTSSFTNTEGWNGWSQKTCIWGEFMKTSFPTP